MVSVCQMSGTSVLWKLRDADASPSNADNPTPAVAVHGSASVCAQGSELVVWMRDGARCVPI
jgi:hypothetical protein